MKGCCELVVILSDLQQRAEDFSGMYLICTGVVCLFLLSLCLSDTGTAEVTDQAAAFGFDRLLFYKENCLLFCSRDVVIFLFPRPFLSHSFSITKLFFFVCERFFPWVWLAKSAAMYSYVFPVYAIHYAYICSVLVVVVLVLNFCTLSVTYMDTNTVQAQKV